MKKALLTLLTPFSLLADTSCIPLENTSCYPFAFNPPLVSHSCCVWEARLDFLYWRPSADENAFAQVFATDFLSTNPFGTSGSFSSDLREYKYDYEAGFRAGIHAGLPCNEWAVGLDWTHFLHTAQGVASVNGNNQVALSTYLNIGHFIPDDNGIVFADSSVHSEWRIQHDVIDLTFGREFYVGHKVTLRPYGGLRSLLLRQKVEATNFISGAELGLNYKNSITNVNGESSFKGVGLIGGFSATWDFFCDFGFYSDVAASAFYGKSRSNLGGYLTNPGFVFVDSMNFLSADFEHNVNAMKVALDFALGLQWKKQLFSNDSLICLKAGWEEHIFFNQNTLGKLNLDEMFLAGGTFKKPSSDISFQGLVLSTSFTY